MPKFRATNLTTDEVTEYEATLPDPEHLGAGWQLSEVITPVPSPDDPPVEPGPVYGGRRALTHLEFLRLFTMEERIAMRRASKLSEVLEDYLDLLKLAQEINLDDPDTIAGVQMMEAGELIGEGRAAEVLRG
jgi:hypothetical protein